MKKGQRPHAQIDQTAEQQVDQNLEELYWVEIPFEQQHLEQNKEQVEQKGTHPKADARKLQAEYIGHAGNLRSAQCTFGYKCNPKGIDGDP